MKHIPHTSRVFIGLLIICLLLTYIAITLSHYQERLIFDFGTMRKVGSQSKPNKTPDTKNWNSYQDTAYPIAFSYPQNWKADSKLTDDIYDITLGTEGSNNPIHIYISEEDNISFEGLKKEPYAIGNYTGSIVNDNLIGIKAGEYYYTFDATATDSAQLEEFKALLKTVTFR